MQVGVEQKQNMMAENAELSTERKRRLTKPGTVSPRIVRLRCRVAHAYRLGIGIYIGRRHSLHTRRALTTRGQPAKS